MQINYFMRAVCAHCVACCFPPYDFLSIGRFHFFFCISPIRKLCSTEEEKTTFFSALVQPHTNMNIIRCFVRCFRFTLYGYYHTLTIWVRVFISNSHNVSSCCSCLTHFLECVIITTIATISIVPMALWTVAAAVTRCCCFRYIGSIVRIIRQLCLVGVFWLFCVEKTTTGRVCIFVGWFSIFPQTFFLSMILLHS